MEVSDYTYDPRIRRRHIPLLTQQKRLRHLNAVFARNVTAPGLSESDNFGLFYTIHFDMDSEPIYTSERCEGNLNPTWQRLESSRFQHYGNHASSSFVIRVWVVRNNVFSATCIIEWMVHLRGLRYLGEQVPKDGRKFLPNSLLFAMPEGIYGTPDCIVQGPKSDGQGYTVHEVLYSDPSVVRCSCTVHGLKRLLITERAIKQTLASVLRVRRAIEQRLRERVRLQKVQADREQLQLTVQMLQQKRDECTALRDRERALADQHQMELRQKEGEVARMADDLVVQRDNLRVQREHYIASRKDLLTTCGLLKMRRRQLISDLLFIFPIVPFPDRKGYSICSVFLPHSEDFIGRDDLMISVALGYVTKVVLMVSFFLGVPLQYPLTYFGTYSSVRDNLSEKLTEDLRTLPLYIKGRERMLFNYSVYLLNKDIAQLRCHCDMKTPDLRFTLLNLYTLLTSYGEDDGESAGSRQGTLRNPPSALLNHAMGADNRSSDELFSQQLQHSAESSTSGHGSGHHINIASLLQQPQPEANGSSAMILLSSSLDKGLNHLHEREEETSAQHLRPLPQLLRRQGSHHSSEPNLRAFEARNRAKTIDLAVVMRPVVYAAEDDSISQTTCDGTVELAVDTLFDAELTARTEQLASARRSFRTCTSTLSNVPDAKM